MRGNEWSLTKEVSTNDRTCQTECSEMEWSVLRTNERNCLQQQCKCVGFSDCCSSLVELTCKQITHRLVWLVKPERAVGFSS